MPSGSSRADAVWVFGYGSLIWRPDFPHAERRPASITGWTRRFWQGSHDHRGLPHAPGRVVTLIEAPATRCHGIAYLIAEEVFEHLDHREKNGYERYEVALEFDDGRAPGVVYIAPRDNHAFLGPAPMEEIADQIAVSAGPSGTNRDYLYRLGEALRHLDAHDPHVFELEALVRHRDVDGSRVQR
jgi:cation transport protein ChaC